MRRALARWFGVFSAIVLTSSITVGARAQPRSDATAEARAEAHEIFERAREALVTGRFAYARDVLRESMALYPTSASAFNLAVALRGTGEVVEASALLTSLRASTYGTLAPEQDAQVLELLREVEHDIATLVIAAGGAPAISIRVDGDRAGEVTIESPVVLRIDPGRHVVVASSDGMHDVSRRVEVGRGERHRVLLHLTRPIAVATGTPLVEEPAFWAVFGSSVVAAIVGVVVGVAVYEANDGLIRDPVFGNTETLIAW